MKKIFLLCMIGLLPNIVYAEVLTPITDINCDKVQIEVSGVNEDAYIFTRTESLAKFPNPAKEIILGDYIRSNEKKYKLECPLFNISYDGNVLSVNASDFKSITNLFKNERYRNFNLGGAFKDIYENEGAVPLYSVGSYKYPNLRMDFVSAGYKLNLESLWLVENGFSLKEARPYTRDDYQVRTLRDAILAYVVDGKELKPFFFNSVLYPTIQEFKDAKKIEIYHKRVNTGDVGVILEKIEIDKTDNTLKLYKKFEFPKSS